MRLFMFLLMIPFALAHSSSEDSALTVWFTPEPAKEGAKTIISFSISNESALEINHERLVHVMIAGEDLKTFTHLHPDKFTGGMDKVNQSEFFVKYAFPRSGRYVMAVDYKEGDEARESKVEFDVIGESIPTRQDDYSRTRTIGEYRISADMEKVKVGEPAIITFTLEKEGKPIENLQRYLGSEVHAMVVHETLSIAEHAHAYSPMEHGHGSGMQHYFGPHVQIRYTFTKAGTYAIFAQFQHEGNVITAPFHVKVSEPWSWLHYTALSAGVILLICIFMAFRSRSR